MFVYNSVISITNLNKACDEDEEIARLMTAVITENSQLFQFLLLSNRKADKLIDQFDE